MIWLPMARPWVVPPVSSSIVCSRLGCGSGLLRACVTGWLEVAVAANCGITFSGSPAETARSGRYPKTGLETFPVLVPWQRRQFSY